MLEKKSMKGETLQPSSIPLRMDLSLTSPSLIRYPSPRSLLILKVLSHAFKEVHVDPADRNVIFTEAATGGPKANREKLAEQLFENLGVSSMFLAPQPSLATYSSGFSTGLPHLDFI